MSEGVWRLRSGVLDLRTPRVVGILNVTPDSFSDGGRWHDPHLALEHASALVAGGADMIDVGGESTRPGAVPVAAAEEVQRILPVLRLLKSHLQVPVSVDTRKAHVARVVLDAGADAINDVSALADPHMAATVAPSGAGLVLMHMRGTPETMQDQARYNDVAAEVAAELATAVDVARDAEVEPERIVLDPGIGFAKTAAHNLELLAKLDALTELGFPVMLGLSRKRFIGEILDDAAPDQRDVGTAGACVVALFRGVRLFRVHNPRVVRDALRVAEAIRRAEPVAA